MDCDTARLFLQFTHPRGDDLDGPEADELHAHLEQCTTCNAAAMNARRLDHHLGRAMNAVPLPVGLKERIVERLTEERGVFRRRWIHRIAGVAAAAACLMLAVWGYAWYTAPERNRIWKEEVHTAANVSGFDQERANASLRRLGARPGAPGFANYAYLIGEPALAELPGDRTKKVPQFIFAQHTPRSERHAIVYVIPKSQYRVEGPPPQPGGGYRYELVTPEEPGYTYLILYTGESWEWLKSEPRE